MMFWNHTAAGFAALLAAALLACGEAVHEVSNEDAGLLDDDFRGCPEGYPSVARGLEGRNDHWTLRVLEGMPSEPERYRNSWTVQISAAGGSTPDDLQITHGETFMPVHGHDGRVQPRLTRLSEPGQFQVDRLNFTMRGPWQVRLWLRAGTGAEERLVVQVCVAK
ncbi:MAG TPA: hypothetical protein VJR89_23745 [Polyangiales bacterium]|nr:hypothetical protein [Polyangiales bacterium]